MKAGGTDTIEPYMKDTWGVGSPRSDQTSWGVISELSQKEQAHHNGHEPGNGNFQQVQLQRLERELLELKGKWHGQELRHQKRCALLWQHANELRGSGGKKDVEESNTSTPPPPAPSPPDAGCGAGAGEPIQKDDLRTVSVVLPRLPDEGSHQAALWIEPPTW